MTILYSFIFCGVLSLIAQIILDNTKLTPGHITSIFVICGSILGFFNIYNKILNKVGIGASLPITSFGNSLYTSSLIGYKENGIIGLFQNMLKTTSLGITSAIVISFIFTLISKSKD